MAESLDTFASTASRWGQKFTISVVVNNAWPITIIDIGTAFLHSHDFKKASDDSGLPQRKVRFLPPKGSEKYFMELPGMQRMDWNTHVLRLRKPVFCLKDAPRQWRLRLDGALRALGGLPLVSDHSVYLWRTGDTVLAVLSTHADEDSPRP